MAWTPIKEAKLSFKNKGLISNETDIILVSSKGKVYSAIGIRYKNDVNSTHNPVKEGQVIFSHSGTFELIENVEAVDVMPEAYKAEPKPKKEQQIKN